MTVKKLVLVIKDIHENDVVERWQFDIQCDKNFKGEGYVKRNMWNIHSSLFICLFRKSMLLVRFKYLLYILLSRCKTVDKPEGEVKKEIMGVLRQITASVSFLPLLDCQCKEFLYLVLDGV